MKTSRQIIHRARVTMSCGCEVLADFLDASYQKPYAPQDGVTSEAQPTALKVFEFCTKHKKDTNRSMLEFVLAERLDEAIEEGQRQPTALHHAVPTAPPEGMEGGSVEIVPPAGARPRRPLGVKVLKRTTEQFAKAGALTSTMPVAAGDVEPGVKNDVASLDALLKDDAPAEGAGA